AQSASGLVSQLRSLLSGQQDMIANAASLVALLFHELEDVNWVGFYFLRRASGSCIRDTLETSLFARSSAPGG
ncbi:MAG: hypothetical protein V3S21_09290, partial [Xanthomonadales bacterium]